MSAATADRIMSASRPKRKLHWSSDDSTETTICIGDRVYTVMITDQIEASQVAKKAVVKKVGEASFVAFDERELAIPNNNVKLSCVVT